MASLKKLSLLPKYRVEAGKGRRDFLFMIIYSTEQLKNFDLYKIKGKVDTANKRFKDKIVKSDVLYLLERFNYKCFYCSDVLDPKTWQLDHFYAKATGGLNTIDNLCPSCKWCNIMKNALDGNAFIIRCKKIMTNNFFYKNEIEYHDKNQLHINKY